MSINSYFNPFGRQHGYATPTAVAWNRRTWEVPRVTTSELKTYRAVASFDGSFEIGSRYFDWEVGYQYNRNDWNRWRPATCTRLASPAASARRSTTPHRQGAVRHRRCTDLL